MERLEYSDVITSVHLTLAISVKSEAVEGAGIELAPGTPVG